MNKKSAVPLNHKRNTCNLRMADCHSERRGQEPERLVLCPPLMCFSLTFVFLCDLPSVDCVILISVNSP